MHAIRRGLAVVDRDRRMRQTYRRRRFCMVLLTTSWTVLLHK